MKKLVTIFLAMVLILGISAAPVFAENNVATWNVPGDFTTIQEAIDSTSVASGDIILVGSGSYAGALVTKAVEIRGLDGAVIDDGPAHGSGLIMGFRLLSGSDGTKISHLQFEVDLAIMNGAAVDNVTVEHCTFLNSIQAVSNWRGNGWIISHNDIVDLRCRNGGGIGILIGDYAGGIVENNIVSYNNISGTLFVNPADGGGYNGSGIVLYADFRWGALGSSEMKNNTIVHNKISLVSDTPSVVDVAAFEMTDTRDIATIPPVIFDNVVGFNTFRGTVIQVVLMPDNLGEFNDISRNLGDNRGHGLRPSLFTP